MPGLDKNSEQNEVLRVIFHLRKNVAFLEGSSLKNLETDSPVSTNFVMLTYFPVSRWRVPLLNPE